MKVYIDIHALRARIEQRVEPEPNTGCWLWLLAVNKKSGYGQMGVNGRVLYAHRVAYEAWRGPIPEGLTIDHLCRVRSCVNPDHLEAVTMRENTLRGESTAARNARKTHCPEGHPIEAGNANTKTWNGWRRCRTCFNARCRAYYVAK